MLANMGFDPKPKVKRHPALESVSTTSISHSSSSNERHETMPLRQRLEACHKKVVTARRGSSGSVINVSRRSRFEDRRRRSDDDGTPTNSTMNRGHHRRRTNSFHGEERRGRSRSARRIGEEIGRTRGFVRSDGDLLGRRSVLAGRLEMARRPSFERKLLDSRTHSMEHKERGSYRSIERHERSSGERRMPRSTSLPARRHSPTTRSRSRPQRESSFRSPREELHSFHRHRSSRCFEQDRRLSDWRRSPQRCRHSSRPRPKPREDYHARHARHDKKESRSKRREAKKKQIMQRSSEYNAERDRREEARRERHGTVVSERLYNLDSSSELEGSDGLVKSSNRPSQKSRTEATLCSSEASDSLVVKSPNQTSQKSRAKEALRQANINLLSRQLSGLDLDSHNATSNSESPPVLPPAPPRPIGRSRSFMSRIDEKEGTVPFVDAAPGTDAKEVLRRNVSLLSSQLSGLNLDTHDANSNIELPPVPPPAPPRPIGRPSSFRSRSDEKEGIASCVDAAPGIDVHVGADAASIKGTVVGECLPETADEVRPVERRESLMDAQDSIGVCALVLRKDSDADSFGIGSLAFAEEDDGLSQDRTDESYHQSTFNESIDVIDTHDHYDSIIDSRLAKRRSSTDSSQDTSMTDSISRAKKVSFRVMADGIATTLKAGSICSFSTSKRKETEDLGSRVDQVMEKISQYKKNLQRRNSLSQADGVCDRKAMSTSITATHILSQKIPPPPPRRAQTFDGQSPGSNSKTKVTSPRPPPPPFWYKKHVSPGTDQEATSITPSLHRNERPITSSNALPPTAQCQQVEKGNKEHTPPPPSLHRSKPPITSPNVIPPMVQCHDPIDHLLSQIKQVEKGTSVHKRGFRSSISDGNTRNGDQAPKASTLGRRASATATRPCQQDNSSEVANMPYKDLTGKLGLYTGEVDQWGRPHGEGRMDYENGDSFKRKWINGVLLQEPLAFQPGMVLYHA